MATAIIPRPDDQLPATPAPEPARKAKRERPVAPAGGDVGSYTQAEVAGLFHKWPQDLYKMPHVQACRIPTGGRSVRYSKRKIDAILNGETPARGRR